MGRMQGAYYLEASFGLLSRFRAYGGALGRNLGDIRVVTTGASMLFYIKKRPTVSCKSPP